MTIYSIWIIDVTCLSFVFIYDFSQKMNIVTCQPKHFWKLRFDDFDVISFRTYVTFTYYEGTSMCFACLLNEFANNFPCFDLP